MARQSRHGTVSRYRKGCRCDECFRAKRRSDECNRTNPNGAKHGTVSMYSRGCRCEPCYKAKSQRNERYRDGAELGYHSVEFFKSLSEYNKRRIRRRGGRPRTPWVHGTTSAYVRGCRCKQCTDAASDYSFKLKLVAKLRPHFLSYPDPDKYLWGFTDLELIEIRDEIFPPKIPQSAICGTAQSYTVGECRCAKCVEVYREYNRAAAQKRRDKKRAQADAERTEREARAAERAAELKQLAAEAQVRADRLRRDS